MASTRITNNMTVRNYLSSLRTNLGSMTKSSQKLSTQRTFNNASENVADAAKALRVRKLLADNDRQTSTAESLYGKLDTASQMLNNFSSVFSDMTDLVTRGLNDTLSDQDRQVLAQDIRSLRDEALTLANGTYGNKYIFNSAGNAASEMPFKVGDDNKLYYNGNTVAIDDMVSTATGKPGIKNDITGEISELPYNGNTYVDLGLGLVVEGSGTDAVIDTRTVVKSSISGLEVFGFGTDDQGLPKNFYSLFEQIASDMELSSMSALSKELTAIGNAHDTLLIGIADLGNTMNFTDTMLTQLNNDKASLQELQNGVEAVDLSEEIMNNANFEMAWTVTLQMGSKILPQSIFEFL